MTVLGDILTEVTFTRVFLFGSLFLLVSFIVDLLTQPRYPSEIPVLGHSSEKWFSRIRNSLAYFTQHQAWIGEGYEKVTPRTHATTTHFLRFLYSTAKMAFHLLLRRPYRVLQTSSFPVLKSPG